MFPAVLKQSDKEIAATSKKQADGIGQVNKAVVEKDKVAQQNVTNALRVGLCV